MFILLGDRAVAEERYRYRSASRISPTSSPTSIMPSKSFLDSLRIWTRKFEPNMKSYDVRVFGPVDVYVPMYCYPSTLKVLPPLFRPRFLLRLSVAAGSWTLPSSQRPYRSCTEGSEQPRQCSRPIAVVSPKACLQSGANAAHSRLVADHFMTFP